MKKICVVIPVHLAILNHAETISLLQCRKVLFSYAVYLIYPSNLDVTAYTALYPEILLRPVYSNWFSSLEAYNTMKRSKDFYSFFKEYQYMLTYELDAYIFSDDWNKANCFQYDYIGAPWFQSYGHGSAKNKIMGVGNSGFSMRNIATCIRVLEKREEIKIWWQRFLKLKLNKIIPFAFLLRILHDKSWKRNSNNYYFIPFTTDKHVSEDIFWGNVVPKIFDFKIASVADSIKFSFEVHPSQLYQMNYEQLPLGCHAWQKYEPDFWKNYIS